MATTNEQMNNLLSPDDMMLEGMEEGTFEQAKKDTAEFAKSVARGSITSPITGAADVVDVGKMLPELDKDVKPLFPVYSSVEGAFEELSKLGISRDNAVKAIKNVTGIELKGDTGEFIGEFISPVAATKAASAIASSAAKYGMEASKAVSRISTEAKKLFSDAGGFDDLAMATAGSPSGQTAKMLGQKSLPDTSVTKIIIGQSGKDYEKKSSAYSKAKQTLFPGKNRIDDQDAQDLWNRTGAQEDVVDGDIVYEVPTAKAKFNFRSGAFDYVSLGRDTGKRNVQDVRKTKEYKDLGDSDKEASHIAFTMNAKKERENPFVLSDILDFDNLYEQAPYLKNIEIKRVPPLTSFKTSAAYDPTEKVIYLSSGREKNMMSDLLHEVEHAVQDADGKTFTGGNVEKFKRADPEYKRLGGANAYNNYKQLERELIDDFDEKTKIGKLYVRELLKAFRNFDNPNSFVAKINDIPEAKSGEMLEYAKNNIPELEEIFDYDFKINDMIKIIRETPRADMENLIKTYNQLGLNVLGEFDKINERAVLKYFRDPGEVTSRNVEFRYLTSLKDPTITQVVPRVTEDRVSRLGQRSMEPDISAEELAEEAAKRNVELTDEGYYLSTAAERGDTAQSLAEQTSDAFAKPLNIGVSEFNVKNVDNPNIIKSYTLDDYNEAMSATTKSTAGSKAANKKINAPVEEGRDVSVRLNLNSKIDPDGPKEPSNHMQTIHPVRPNGKPDYNKADSYMSGVTVKNGVFDVNQTGRRHIAETGEKVPAASVQGTFTSTRNVFEEGGDVVEIGMNPKNLHLFVDLKTGQAVRGFERATIFRDRVYAKGVTYWKKAEAPEPLPAKGDTSIDNQVRYKFKQGGAVPMNTMTKQMNMFDEGGLMDEGGTMDPVSGNDVPPGSTQEEVRDDIPAQLSEGEFVFPADVVRYIGLETLMRMRQEAKMGLAQMEAMGQMGNGEEATMPDDLPFDMYDLDIEEDGLQMNVGGVVPSTNTSGSFNPQTNQFQPFGGSVSNLGIAPAPFTAASASPYTTGQINPSLQGTTFTPTTVSPIAPTFQEAIGGGVVGVDYEFVDFTNEAGQKIRLRRNKSNGQMIDVVPEGFSEEVKEEEQVQATPTTGTTGVRTSRVSEDGAGDKEDVTTSGASVAFGGELVDGRVVGGYKGDLSFSNMSFQDMRKFGIGIPSSLLGQLQGKPNTNTIPDKAIANVTNLSKTRPDGVYSGPPKVEVAATVRMSGKNYNELLTGQNVTQRRRMESAIDFIKDKYKDQAMDPDKIIDLDKELADMDMREDVRETLAGSDFSTELKEEISANNEIGNVSVNKEGKLSIRNQFEAERVAIQRQRDKGKDVAPDEDKDSGMGSGSSSSDSGPNPEPAAEGQWGDFNKGGLAKQMKRSGLASRK